VSAAALLVAILAALGAAVAAALHGPVVLVGLLAALTAFAAAVAAGAAAVQLRAPNTLTEPRHPQGPSTPPPLPDDVLARRGAFGRLWWIAFAAFALAGLEPLISLGRMPRRNGTAWRGGARLVTPQGTPLRPDDLAVGGVTTVFPEGRVDAPESAVLLLRLQDGVMQLGPERRDWVQQGNVAFSKICTHAGCPVAIFRHLTYELYCPCHQSVFDVLHGAQPVSGPATRALPQLALDLDHDGYLVARGDFTEPVGPDSWWRTL